MGNEGSTDLHFMGIGGAGMSALAELFARNGFAVSGCDTHPEGARDLSSSGVRIDAGHDASHADRASKLVYSSAIPRDHPEILRAKERGIPVVRRAEALAEAVSRGRLIGVAGTHGKSTTTAMVAEALASAGLNPTALVGARITSWNGNLRRGANDLFVVEADEYDRSFLALDPEVAVVTNVEADHLDTYRDLADVRAAFARYVEGARYVVLCADDAGANQLPSPPTAEVVRYGLTSADARLVARDIRLEEGTTTFAVWYDGKPVGEVHLQVPGEHNVRNALAAIAVGLLWGYTVEAMAPGLAHFGGVERRFQRLGEVGGVFVVDDYAHHPTEIRATLSAARNAFPGRRIVIAFQPHLFSRTRDFASDFGAALAEADAVALTEIYPAREQPIAGVTSDLIADAMRARGATPVWRGARDALAHELAVILRPGDVVLTVGAGDITKTGPELFARLAT